MKHVIPTGPIPAPGAGSRWAVVALTVLPLLALGQDGDTQLHAKADALFATGSYAQALPMYSQLVSLEPGDHDLNYRLGACSLYGGDGKEKAIGYLKFAVQGPATDNLAWYFLGRAYHLDYQFDAAITAYGHFRGTADKKLLEKFPVDALAQQCRNGKDLLGNIKDIKVFSKVDVAAPDFFRFYDLSDIGGKIVITPEELMTALDRKSKEHSLVYLPNGGGTIYFSSYGRDGRTGRDIYRTEVLPTGGFSDPVKLAGYVNTDQDEAYAVMAPDGKTFYFCSKGHNSMGGYDVFKSSYDKTSGIFGPPENMDFAVNTPADELLYIVGPDGKQACFASSRESQQDMETVYRVGTTPAPVNLTVIKGTFASAFDIMDRKAHIVVEDALTREKVADVKTGINGTYLLTLPHGGRYSFLVEGGPSGKTHLGSVDIPSSDQPAAYAQEISLVNEGGEKLSITDHFDQALNEDVMALALDDVKRRAKLDVTEENAVVATATPDAHVEDPMDAAGFAGNMSVDDALKLAQGQQEDLTELAEGEGNAAEAAFALAASNVDAAEKASSLAQELVLQTGPMAEGPDRDSLMTQAAEARQQAKEANDRARAALATGHELKAAQQGNQVLVTKAATTTGSLAQAVKAKDKAGTTEALKQLKAQVDQQTGPKAAMTDSERARKAASDAEKVAAGKLAQANAQREDEVALAERIASLKRERDGAKGKKNDDLAQQVAKLEEQHTALMEEADAAFAKARKAQEDAAMARGQEALLAHLQADTTVLATPTPMPDLAAMEQRMSQVNTNIAALAIDQRYDASTTGPVAEKERRTFDWGEGADQLVQTANIRGTDARVATVPTTVATHAVDGEVTISTAGKGSGVKQTTPTATAVRAEGNSSATRTDQAASDGIVQVALADSTGGGGPLSAAVTSSTGQDERSMAELRSSAPMPDPSGQQQGGPDSSPVVNPADGDLPDEEDVVAGKTQEAAGPEGDGPEIVSVDDAEEQMFFSSNKLAELKQLRQGAGRKAERDSIDGEIEAQEQRIAALHQARVELDAQAEAPSDTHAGTADPEEAASAGTLRYTLLENDAATLALQSVDDLIPGFTLRQKQIAEGVGNERSKAIARHQLEMELVDSIDAHLAIQADRLAQHPEDAATIQPTIDHLQELRTQHVAVANETLAVARQQATPMDGSPSASVGHSPVPALAETEGGPTDGHVVIAPDPASIFESVVDYRSPKAHDAAAINAGEVKQAKAVQAKVDSLEDLLAGMPEGEASDDLGRQTDKAKDDLLILRSEIGERTGFIMREEYAAVLDSVAALGRSVRDLGRPAEEPLAQMATAFVQSAQADKDHGALLRKGAAKTGDILVRDSLYRIAYADELHALQKLDQAITVRNYIVERRPAECESLTYAEVEARISEGPTDDASTMEPAEMKVAHAAVVDTMGRSEALDTTTFALVPVPSKDDVKMEVVPDPAPGPTAVPSAVSIASSEESGSGGPVSGTSTGTNLDKPSTNGAEAAPDVEPGPVVSTAVAATGLLAAEENHPNGSTADTVQGPAARPDTVEAGKMQTPMSDAGHGQYFLLRSRARDGRQASDAALADAEKRTDQAWELKNQAATLAATNGDEAEATRMDTRSKALFAQADSFRVVAQGLAGSAANFDAQADAYLARIPREQAGALQAMEDARPKAAPVVQASSSTPAPTEQVAVVPTLPENAAPSAQAVPMDTVPVPVAVPESAGPIEVPVELPVRTAEAVPAPAPKSNPASMPPRPNTTSAFAIGPDIAPRQDAIPMDVAMPKGLVYMVQVGAFRNELLAKAFQDLSPVSGIHVGNGLMRYSAGRFEDREEALKAQDLIRARGYKDAFVVAYMDGQRVTLKQAEKADGAATVAVISSATPPAEASGPTPVITLAPTTTQANNGEASVLAKYPTSAQAVMEDFHPMPTNDNYYNDPTAAPAKQVETIKGLFFTVQVGVYSKPTALDHLFNITPLNSEHTANGKIRYTTGMFREVTSASTRKNATVALGVTDAFVTAYLNGKRIPLGDARALLAKLGPSILVDPQLSTP